jgi:hypothetical protein
VIWRKVLWRKPLGRRALWVSAYIYMKEIAAVLSLLSWFKLQKKQHIKRKAKRKVLQPITDVALLDNVKI